MRSISVERSRRFDERLFVDFGRQCVGGKRRVVSCEKDAIRVYLAHTRI